MHCDRWTARNGSQAVCLFNHTVSKTTNLRYFLRSHIHNALALYTVLFIGFNLFLRLHQVTRLCDLAVDNDSVTSVAWNERASILVKLSSSKESSTTQYNLDKW